jgi:hypothetical protein
MDLLVDLELHIQGSWYPSMGRLKHVRRLPFYVLEVARAFASPAVGPDLAVYSEPGQQQAAASASWFDRLSDPLSQETDAAVRKEKNSRVSLTMDSQGFEHALGILLILEVKNGRKILYLSCYMLKINMRVGRGGEVLPMLVVMRVRPKESPVFGAFSSLGWGFVGLNFSVAVRVPDSIKSANLPKFVRK